jgi:ferredoxin--NADP+ reductase
MTPDEIAHLRQSRYNATVVSLRMLHADLMILRVKPDFPRGPHVPGQYCTLGLGYWEPRADECQPEHLKPEDLPKIVRRSYSVSCSIYKDHLGGPLRDLAEDDWLEFYIVLVRENSEGRVPALTPRLFKLKEGDRVQVGEKVVGHYTTAAVKSGDNVIFLGTGTGEAPHNFMTWDLLKKGHAGKILHACCVRYKRDLGYLHTHEALMKQYPNYKYLPLTTREATVTNKVYIQDVITGGELEQQLAAPLDPEKTHVYLCGNPKMIGVPYKDKETGERKYPDPVGVIQILEDRGFKADNAATKFKGNIHFEEYW